MFATRQIRGFLSKRIHLVFLREEGEQFRIIALELSFHYFLLFLLLLTLKLLVLN